MRPTQKEKEEQWKNVYNCKVKSMQKIKKQLVEKEIKQ